jgi:RNA polymerase sporulation-specific sigma factor
LQQETGEDGFSLEQVLGDWTQEERLVEYVALRQAIEKLPEKERQVVFLRFYHGMTQERASRVLQVSQVQVSRLERRAVKRLRELLE